MEGIEPVIDSLVFRDHTEGRDVLLTSSLLHQGNHTIEQLCLLIRSYPFTTIQSWQSEGRVLELAQVVVVRAELLAGPFVLAETLMCPMDYYQFFMRKTCSMTCFVSFKQR